MEFTQNLDPNVLIYVAVACGLLLVVGLILFLAAQFLGTILSTLELLLEVVAGGPIAWCGCLLVILGCAVCGGVGIMLATSLRSCGTPQAVNLCSVFGL